MKWLCMSGWGALILVVILFNVYIGSVKNHEKVVQNIHELQIMEYKAQVAMYKCASSNYWSMVMDYSSICTNYAGTVERCERMIDELMFTVWSYKWDEWYREHRKNLTPELLAFDERCKVEAWKYWRLYKK